MKPRHERLSSRELLARIGLDEDAPSNLLDDEPLDDLSGDLSTILQTRYRLLNDHHAFAPGDLVHWKPGLKNKTCPLYAQPAVVDVLDPPVRRQDQDEAGSTYFREPLDLVLGLIWNSGAGRGDFLTFHVDSRRFQPWQETQ